LRVKADTADRPGHNAIAVRREGRQGEWRRKMERCGRKAEKVGKKEIIN